jgi:hypothetical protein
MPKRTRLLTIAAAETEAYTDPRSPHQVETSVERNHRANRDAYVRRIDEQIADLTARRDALINPPLAKDDVVVDRDESDGTRWRVTGVDTIDPRMVHLTSIAEHRWDERRRGNWQTSTLVKV